MSNYHFRKDLDRSKLNEEFVSGILIKYFKDRLNFVHNMVLIPNDNNEFDLDIGMYNEETDLAINFTVELKEDFYCKKSGNVAIEVECRGKPSGIEVSKATFWAYTLHTPNDGKKVVVFDRQAFLNKLRLNLVPYVEKVGGDKGSKTRLLLIKLDDFLKEVEVLL